MTGLLSTISGYFSKSLILGTLLPVTVFVISFFIFISPLLPSDPEVLLPLTALDPQWQLLAITLSTVLLSGLIYSLNVPLIQLFEGYPWIETRIGKRRTLHYQSVYAEADHRIKGTRTLLRAMNRASTENKIASVQNELSTISVDPTCASNWENSYKKIETGWNTLQQNVFTAYPTETSLILPTKLGNAIRSFEYYPDREYDMDAVTTWSRLIAKIDPGYAASIDDAKISLDFMINLSFLGVVSFLIQIIAGLFFLKPFSSPSDLSSWLVRLLITAIWMCLFYHLSISRAIAWGETVKGSFDLYRKDLLQQLGYDVKFANREQEKAFWDKLAVQMIYGDGPEGSRAPDYTKESTPAFLAQAEPADVVLNVTRGVEELPLSHKLTIVTLIKNIDPQKRDAKNVIVTDTIPNDLYYHWNSASLNGNYISVEGTNPYLFQLGPLPHGKELQLEYKVIRLR